MNPVICCSFSSLLVQEAVCNDVTIITTTNPLKNKSSEAKLFKLLRLVEMQTSDNTHIVLDS